MRITTGYHDNGSQIYKTLGYFPTRKDAMIALADYNKDPYDIDLSKATMSEVYKAWSEEAFPNLNKSMEGAYRSAYKHCALVYDRQYKTLRKGHMQACIDKCGKGYSTKSNIKMLFLQLDKYAYDHDIISKCYSQNLDIGTRTASDKHSLIPDEDVQLLWRHQGEPFVDETLFMLYTGFRMSEMLQMRNEDVTDTTLTGGIKTAAGKNRIVPIHSDLKPIIQNHMSEKEFLFALDENQASEQYRVKFSQQWKKAMTAIGFNHLTHDCRHTVRSKLDSAGANKVAIDRIMGHSSGSIGERVYTHKTIEELQAVINMLSYSKTQ